MQPFLDFVKFCFFCLRYSKNTNLANSRNGDVGILSKTTSFRKNSWQLNHSRVSGAMGQKPLSRSNRDYATAVCLQRWRAKRPRRKFPSYSSNSEEMPLSFKHIFALIPYTMPLFGGASVYTWHCPNIHVSESYV